MAKSKKIFLSTVLGISCLTAGCFSNGGGNQQKDDPDPINPVIDDKDYDYDYPYYITDEKVMETEEKEAKEGKTHLYVRAWDCKNSTKKDGYYGLQRAGEYSYNNFTQAFNPDTKMFSYEPITGSSSEECKTKWKAELTEFFKDNGENDINYIFISCNSDGNVNLTIFDDYAEGTSYKHYVAFTDFVNWLKDFKGRFFIISSAAYSGRCINSSWVASYGFIDKLDKQKFTIITQATDGGTFTPYSYKSTTDTTITLPSDLGSAISQGVLKDKNGNFACDYDGDGNLTIDELYTYGRTSYGTNGTYAEIFAPDRMDEVLLTNHKIDLYSLSSGSFVEDGNERLTVEVPENKIIKSIGMPKIKEGYKFTGWSYDREGTEKVTFPLELGGNTKLFAKYECKKDAKPGYITPQQYDTVRIPYKEGAYNDFYILDFKTNEGEPGMFLVSTDIAGMARYPMASETKYSWEGTYAQWWCQEYVNKFFTEELNKIVIPCNATLGSNDPSLHLNNEKLFYLSKEEVENFLTPDILALSLDYFLRGDKTSLNNQVKTTGDFKEISKSVKDTKATRPALNLNISKSDLEYDKETNTFYVKSLGKYVRTAPQRYNGTYTVKVDGQVTFTAEGNRKLACDNMNTLASSRWETKKPWTYKDGYGQFLFKPGKYRGTLYNTNLRDFYEYEHIEECFVGTQVHGLDCAAAVSAAYTLTFGKKFINNLDVAEKDEYLYGCMQYAADAIDPGIGGLPDYLKNKTSGTVTHHDLVHIPGNPETPTMPNNETTLFGFALNEALETKGTNIHEAVYQYVQPGDGIVSRGQEYQNNDPTGKVLGSTSHTRMVIGVDVIHDDAGKIDTAKSKVYYADTSTPKATRFIFGGESCSYHTFDTYNGNYPNEISFDDLYAEGYLPFSLNNWNDGYTDSQIYHATQE